MPLKIKGLTSGSVVIKAPDTGADDVEYDIANDFASTARVNAVGGRKNLIINGGFDVWQRGTSFSANGYNSDRWYMATNGTMSVAKTWSSDLSMYYFDASNTVTWGVYQKVEDKNCNHLKTGDTITISFWSNTAMSIQFGVSSIATAVYSTSVIDTIGSWSRRSVAITMTSTLINGIQAGNPMYVEVKPNATGSFGFTGVQLELGSVATEFEHRSYGEELALCQRYYQHIPNHFVDTLNSSYNDLATKRYAYHHRVDLPVTMRTSPTVIYFKYKAGTYDRSSHMSVTVNNGRVIGYRNGNSSWTGGTSDTFFEAKLDAEL